MKTFQLMNQPKIKKGQSKEKINRVKIMREITDYNFN